MVGARLVGVGVFIAAGATATVVPGVGELIAGGASGDAIVGVEELVAPGSVVTKRTFQLAELSRIAGRIWPLSGMCVPLQPEQEHQYQENNDMPHATCIRSRPVWAPDSGGPAICAAHSGSNRAD